MLYLINQMDVEGLDPEFVLKHGSQLHSKLLDEGCYLLLNSDQMEFSVYGFKEELLSGIRKICETFGKYSIEIAHVDFQFDVFTWEEIEISGHFPLEFISALRKAEGKGTVN